jgi:CheY-like chemotaxis protein
MSAHREMDILVAEDDGGHAELIREGLLNSGLLSRIVRFWNGEELWNFLTGSVVRGESFSAQKAYVLILDSNMPRMDGFEVLSRIKSDPSLRKIPVIMLTTTDEPRDIERCYQLGCNIYITKPVEFGQFAENLHQLGLFLQVMKV